MGRLTNDTVKRISLDSVTLLVLESTGRLPTEPLVVSWSCIHGNEASVFNNTSLLSLRCFCHHLALLHHCFIPLPVALSLRSRLHSTTLTSGYCVGIIVGNVKRSDIERGDILTHLATTPSSSRRHRARTRYHKLIDCHLSSCHLRSFRRTSSNAALRIRSRFLRCPSHPRACHRKTTLGQPNRVQMTRMKFHLDKTGCPVLSHGQLH